MKIYMRTVEGSPEMRALTKPLIYFDNKTKSHDFIPEGFKWDGSSSPKILQGIFPRHRHPIASCRHDYRCGRAKCDADRKFADQEFKKDVARTSWAITAQVGYMGVRIGAFFGVGSNYK